MIKKYETKPCTIEALEWSVHNYEEMKEFTKNKAELVLVTSMKQALVIETLEGKMIAEKGDFIIKGLRGEFYPCKPDVFLKKYKEI